MPVEGARRTFLVRGTTSPGRHPLVVLFHGYGETAQWIDRYTGFSHAASRRGFVTALPQGIDGQWNFRRDPADILPDDVEFARRLVSVLEEHDCVDPRRVYAAGFSDGADMANTMICADDGQFSGVAGVAASVIPHGCSAPAAVMEFHGTADPVVPYDGGGRRPPPFDNATPVSVTRQIAGWRRVEGCTGPPLSKALSASVELLTFGPCSPGSRLQFVKVRGGGHTWPGARQQLPYGSTDGSISATEQILTFFSRD